MSTTTYTRQESAFGPLLLRAQNGTLTGLFFADQPHAPAIGTDWMRDDDADIFTQTLREIDEFAVGERHEFHVDAGLVGRPFQVQVWREIAAIPYGETRSYGEISRLLGASPRAVGSATGRNPLCLIIPCHRVVGTNGALTGYAGGLGRKQRLLDLEKKAASCTVAIA
jgi:methylated-DNA-[protein]-cysteine S-methyltransferase